MPATNLSDKKREADAEALQGRLVRIYEKRDDLLISPPPPGPAQPSLTPAQLPRVLDDDPAVAAVGVRWVFDDGSGGSAVLKAEALPLAVEVRTGALDPNLPAAAVSLELGKGRYVRIGLFALVKSTDLERFDADTLKRHLQPEQPWEDDGYGAFEESVVWAEAASDQLPDAKADNLVLEEGPAGDVYVNYALHQVPREEAKLHDNVFQTRIASERWIWRNLPLPPEGGFAGTDDEMRRRLASGPPAALMDPAHRDDDVGTVAAFDLLSGIDSGFVLRADRLKDYPRGTQQRALLLVDECDGHS